MAEEAIVVVEEGLGAFAITMGRWWGRGGRGGRGFRLLLNVRGFVKIRDDGRGGAGGLAGRGGRGWKAGVGEGAAEETGGGEVDLLFMHSCGSSHSGSSVSSSCGNTVVRGRIKRVKYEDKWIKLNK